MALSPARRALAALAATALVSAGLVLGTAGAANAATLSVPATYPTITAALAAANPGDTIQVAAGTYTEDLTLTEDVVLTGAGASSIIQGRVTLQAPATVSNFTLQSTDTTDPYNSADPLWLTAGSAGALIFNNTIRNGLHGIYADSVLGSEAATTVIDSNTFSETGYGNTAAVWIAGSSYFVVSNNQFSMALPNNDDAVAVNLVSGSHHVKIVDNNMANFGNAIVIISTLPGIGATTNVEITGNLITGSQYSALYFGGNNITDVTISGNEITGV